MVEFDYHPLVSNNSRTGEGKEDGDGDRDRDGRERECDWECSHTKKA